MPRARSWLVLVAVLAFTALIVGLPAGQAPLWDPNEARYMLLARDILEHGRWLVPDLRGEPYLNKPQLFFWSVAAASLPGGEVTEWTAALPAVLSSVATVAAVFAIGVRAWGLAAGTIAALALASTLGFFAVGHRGQSDVMLAAWTWWALYGLIVARRAGFTAVPLAGFYAGVAAAIMSKGPMGLIGLGAGVVSISATDGWAGMRRLRPRLGLGVLAVLLLPWYGAYLTNHASAFVGDTVVGHYGSWVFRRSLLTRLESLWLLVYALPWTIFVIGAIAWRRRAPDAERRLIAVWTLTIWALIGLSGIHRARYLFPIYPGLALLAGEFLARAGQQGGARELRAAAYGFAGLAAAAAAVGLSPLGRQIGGEGRPWIPDTAGELGLTAALLVVTAVLAVGAARRAAFVATGLIVALGVGTVLIVTGVRYPARFARDFDVRSIAAAARALTPAGVAVPVHPDIWLTYDFYLRRPVAELDRPAVEQLLAGESRGSLIISRKTWSELQPRAHPSWRVVVVHSVASREIVVLGGGGA
jgi:4-amino-4-deoxy-L-arabinose transferase-like glycosyltransferase